ncbi:hypothetical protein ACFXOI_05920 [Streptomyces bacillaris]|uniref:hypothetical protein n=1 Tax=Streptomyces bacillaris TaxID=68179 RepID=UPI003673CFDE
MRTARSLRRAAAVALLVALPILAAPAVIDGQPDRVAVAGDDPGWGRSAPPTPLPTEPPASPMGDPGWG